MNTILLQIIWIVVTIVLSVIACVFLASKHNEKIDDWFIFACGMVLLISEIFKLIFMPQKNGHFDWSMFSLQFCGIPAIVAPLAIVIKNKVIKNAINILLAFFGLISAISVIAMPETILNYPHILLTIQSIIWHSLMFIMSIYLIVAKSYGKHFKELIGGYVAYIICVAVAVIFNFSMRPLWVSWSFTADEVCNAFYIAKDYPETCFPILKNWMGYMPYPVWLLIYIVVFIAGATLLWFVTWLVRKIIAKIQSKKSQKVQA